MGILLKPLLRDTTTAYRSNSLLYLTLNIHAHTPVLITDLCSWPEHPVSLQHWQQPFLHSLQRLGSTLSSHFWQPAEIKMWGHEEYRFVYNLLYWTYSFKSVSVLLLLISIVFPFEHCHTTDREYKLAYKQKEDCILGCWTINQKLATKQLAV